TAIDLAKKLKPDLALMDIKLKGDMTGIEAAAAIKEHVDIPIIFLTANADPATLNRAKITEPHGYILKPFKDIDIHTTIEMAMHKHGKEKQMRDENEWLKSLGEYKASAKHFFVKQKQGQIRLNLEDVVMVEALKDYVTIHTMSDAYKIHSTMKEIEKKLANQDLMRVHRSTIVNLNYVKALKGGDLIMEKAEHQVAVGGSYRQALSERINLL
ncbi:MAG: LytTR family transcriptional regulator DNA-binding domain-containing protein, partial [Planctomycetota bacterium]